MTGRVTETFSVSSPNRSHRTVSLIWQSLQIASAISCSRRSRARAYQNRAGVGEYTLDEEQIEIERIEVQ
jgi:hypothetical protein